MTYVFYETVVKALKWEHNRLQLIQVIQSLKLCDVVEDNRVFSTLITLCSFDTHHCYKYYLIISLSHTKFAHNLFVSNFS